MNASTVLVMGASGYVGRAVCRELTDRGFAVRRLVREDARTEPGDVIIPGLTTAAAQASDADTAAAAAALQTLGPATIVSCIASRTGTPTDAWLIDYQANANVLKLALGANIKRFILLSAICVQRPKLAFQFAKLAFEHELKTSGMPYTIVRPTSFFKSLAGQVHRVAEGKPYLMFGDGTLTQTLPIGTVDLANFIVDALEDPAAVNETLPIGGAGPALTPRDIGELTFEVTGRAPAFRSVSPRWLKAAQATLAGLGRFSKRCAAKSELVGIGHYYATESTVLWNPELERYDARATPTHGEQRLGDYLSDVLDRRVDIEAELGAHRLLKS